MQIKLYTLPESYNFKVDPYQFERNDNMREVFKQFKFIEEMYIEEVNKNLYNVIFTVIYRADLTEHVLCLAEWTNEKGEVKKEKVRLHAELIVKI